MIRAAVLGKPIAHSLSPFVHGEIYQTLGLEYEYSRIELDQESARSFLRKELSKEWSGFSLTMPLKEIGFDLDLRVDEVAQRAHSINTITANGAFNTDASGLARVLRTEGCAFSHVSILGNGATARSSLLGLELLGFEGKIRVLRRNDSKDELLPSIARCRIETTDLEAKWESELTDDSLVISTIPSAAQSEVSSRLFGFQGTLLDVTYSPWPSTLAGVTNGKLISGLTILVAQAIDQASHFTGLEIDKQAMYTQVLSSTVAFLSTR